MKLSKISSKYLRSDFVIEFVVSLVAGVSAFFWAFFFTSEYSMLDLRINLRNYINEALRDSPPERDDRIVLLYLNEATLKNLEDERSVKTDITSRKYLASLINFVSKGKPAVIGLDYFLEDRDPEKGADESLINAISAATASGVPVIGGYSLKPKLAAGNIETDEDSLSMSKRYFDAVRTNTFLRYSEVLTSSGFLNLWQQKTSVYGEDAIPYIRYYLPLFEGSEALPKVIIDQYDRKFKINRPGNNNTAMYINYRDRNPEDLIKVIDSADMEHFMRYPMLIGEEVLANFRDKVVLIGNARSGDDMHQVPVNDQAGIFGVLIHAVILKNYLDNDFIHVTPVLWKWFIILLSFAVTCFITIRYDLKKILLYSLVYVLFFFIFTFIVFYFWSLWIPVMVVVSTQLVTLLVILIARIAVSEKDNLDAVDYLSEYIPAKIITRLSEKIDESLFTPFKDDVYVIAGWAKNLPYSEEYDVSDIKRFIDEYHAMIRNIVFENGGCFNVLPQNGFMAFWPAGFYDGDQFDRVISSAESIRAMIESLNFKASRQFNTGEVIYIDIVILKDQAYVGTFSSVNNGLYSIISDAISGVLQIPWLFSSDEKNSIIIYEEIKNRLPSNKKAVRVDKQIAGHDIYELE